MRAALRPLLRHLLLPAVGILMLFATLAWGAWTGEFSTVLLMMMLVSVGVLIVGVVSQEAGAFRDTAASLVYCVCVLLAGIGLYLVTTNYSQRIDLTEHRIHSLSTQTVQMLQTLENPMEITVFAEARDHETFRRLFDLYTQHSNMVRFVLHDPVTASAAAREFDARILPNTAYITIPGQEDAPSRDRYHRFVLNPGDPYRENVLSNAIQRVDSGSADRIYFLTGHQERSRERRPDAPRDAPDLSWSHFAAMVTDSILPVEDLELFRRGRIPDDAAAIVIASPAIDLNDREREILLDYIMDGGSLFVTLDPLYNARPKPNLGKVLAAMGIQMPERELVDPAAPRRREVLVVASQDHPVTEELAGITFVFNGVREVVVDPEIAHPGRPMAESIMITPSPVSRLDIDRTIARTGVTEATEASRAIVAAASMLPVPEGTRRSTARVIVVGDGDFLSNERLLETPPALLGLNAMRWLAEPENTIAIPPKTFPPSSFTMTPQRFWLMIGLLLLIGVTLLGGGLSFTLARRKLG